MNLNNSILKAIKLALDKEKDRLYYDKTFPSVVCQIKGNGVYTIIKAGQKYDVKCAIPNIDILSGANVWVRIPCGRLHDMHICGLRYADYDKKEKYD